MSCKGLRRRLSHSLRRLNWDSVRKHLDEYAAIASSSKGGRIGIEEFAEYLKLPVSDVLRQLFALFDRVCEHFIADTPTCSGSPRGGDPYGRPQKPVGAVSEEAGPSPWLHGMILLCP